MALDINNIPNPFGYKKGETKPINNMTGLLDFALMANQYIPVSGDIQSGLLAANDINQGNYGNAALNAAGLLPFVPSLGAITKNVDNNIYKALEKENKYTFPKIPVKNIFNQDYQIIPTQKRQAIDTIIDNKKINTLPFKDVDVSKIVPTQKNINFNNLKDVAKVKNPTDEIIAVEDNGLYYLVDGHHRIANQILNKQSNVKIKVLE